MIQIPDGLFAKGDADEAEPAPNFDTELEAARRTAALTQAGAAATQALHDLDRSFDDDAASDPASWPGRFESEVQRIKRDDLADHLGSGDGGAFLRDFDDLASAKLATIRRLGAARELDGGRKGLQNALDNYVGMAADAPSDIEAGIVRDQARAAIARMDQAGFLRAGEADELERGFFDREEATRVTRLIDTDPDSAVEALSDPSRFGSLAPDARLRLRDRAELRAEDAVRESAQAAESTRQGQLAGLILRLDAGEADRADVMEAAASGWLSDAERERALARWENHRQEIRQRESDLNRVKSLFAGAGDPLDTSSEDDRRALETHYDDTKAAWQAAGLTDDQLNPLIADYLVVTGAVPGSLNREIAGAFRDGTWERRIRVSELLDHLFTRIGDWFRRRWYLSPPWDSSDYDPEDFEPDGPFRPGPVPMPDVGPWPRPMPRWPGRDSILDKFDPRDIAEALLINALIGGGWPRAKAPDRAAMLFDRSFEQDDRFASSDRASYEKYLDGLSAQGQIEPQLRTQLVSFVAAPQAGAPSNPESAGAGGPSYADGIDPGGPRYAEGIDTQTEPAPEQGSAEPQVAANPEPALNPEPAPFEQADGQASSPPAEPERTIKGASEATAKKNNPENHSEAGQVLADIVAGRASLDDLRDENGNVRIGAFTLAPDVAEIVSRIIALDPKDEAERQALGKLIGTGWEGDNGRTATQNTLLRTLLGRKLEGGDFLTGRAEWDGLGIARLDEDGAIVEQRVNESVADDLTGRIGQNAKGGSKPPVLEAVKPGGKPFVSPVERRHLEQFHEERAKIEARRAAPGSFTTNTAESANDAFTSAYKVRQPTKEPHPPYLPDTKIHEFKVGSSSAEPDAGKFIRLHRPGTAERPWLARREDVVDTKTGKMLSPDQLKDKFALPRSPTSYSEVTLPPGTRVRVGIANPNSSWGKGRGLQYEILDAPKSGWFGHPLEIVR